jgi:ATP-dependent DNA helicase PIF1
MANIYPSEFLNINGMPSHKLPFKIGTLMMLLCNLDPSARLCNRTRLIVRHFMMRVVEAEIITGKGVGNVAFILRIKLIFNNNGLPFTFAKKQFPLRLAYAMTINKSQGQTLFHVGLHLADDVFSHGQLYVAFSRTKALANIKVQLPDCRNPTLAKCGGEAQHLEKLGIWSPPRLPNVQDSTERPKSPRIGVFLVSLKRS